MFTKSNSVIGGFTARHTLNGKKVIEYGTTRAQAWHNLIDEVARRARMAK